MVGCLRDGATFFSCHGLGVHIDHFGVAGNLVLSGIPDEGDGLFSVAATAAAWRIARFSAEISSPETFTKEPFSMSPFSYPILTLMVSFSGPTPDEEGSVLCVVLLGLTKGLYHVAIDVAVRGTGYVTFNSNGSQLDVGIAGGVIGVGNNRLPSCLTPGLDIGCQSAQ